MLPFLQDMAQLAEKPLSLDLSSRIPPEIVERILHDSLKGTLSTCSLVCSSWLSPCRHHLFAEIILRPSFVEFIHSSPHAVQTVVPHIRSLTLASVWDSTSGQTKEKLSELLPAFSGLRCLYFKKCDWSLVKVFGGASGAMSESKPLQNVTTLRVQSIHFPSFPRFVECIGAFPNLEDLSIDSISWDISPNIVSAEGRLRSRKPTRLTKLAISSCCHEKVLAWLWGNDVQAPDDDREGSGMPFQIPPLHTLALRDLMPTKSHPAGAFVRALGPFLEHLEIGFIGETPNYHLQDVFSPIDLSSSPNLKSISVHNIVLYQFPSFPSLPTDAVQAGTPQSPHLARHHPSAWFLAMLSTIHVSLLSHIAFNIWFSAQYQLDLIDWHGLNTVLLKDSFASLKEIRFMISGIGRDLALVENWIQQRLHATRPTTSLHIELCT